MTDAERLRALADSLNEADRLRAIADRLEKRETLIIEAWGVIANASHGDWSLETPEWQKAAASWRDRAMKEA